MSCGWIILSASAVAGASMRFASADAGLGVHIGIDLRALGRRLRFISSC